jgi:hypothetical protein
MQIEDIQRHTDQTDAFTRIIAAIIVPILWLAFVILTFVPDQSGQRFAWSIAPHMTAAFMGAGYLGGSYVFFRMALGAPWHCVTRSFAPITAFTIAMLVVTVLHWERFDLSHFPFQLWLILYIVTPVLIPYLWLRNRHADPGTLAESDVAVPLAARWAMTLAGIAIGLFALLGFVAPTVLVDLWIWPLTPLTARIMAGWFTLLAVGGLSIGREVRWSAWRIGLVSIAVWHVLVLLAAGINSAEFPNGFINWYTGLVFLSVLGMVGLFVMMERARRTRLVV